MQLLIELDGPILDVAARHHEAHRRAQRALGLPSRDAREFSRLFRKGADLAEIVRPTRSAQLDEYVRLFDQLLSSNQLAELDAPQPNVHDHLAGLARLASCRLIALHRDRQIAQGLLDRYTLWPHFRSLHLLSPDRSVRISQLAELTEREALTVAAVASESLVQSARQAEALVFGLSNGPCTPRRLRQAGADIVFSDLGEVLEAVQQPTDALLRTGFRPPPPGAHD
jgi:phosphoglycolate phosphatase-like HAD superfamily hydrolase